MKYTIPASILLILSIFTGCSENKEENSEQKIVSSSTPQIEVIENKNAHEIKIAQKDGSTSKNDTYYLGYGEKHSYNPNSQPANKDASVRIKPRTTLDANLHVRSPYEEVKVSMLVNKLSKKFLIKCSACHSDYANGIIGPSLLGKDSKYIYNKIMDFKSGKKSNPLMNDLIHMMSDKEIQDMADEIYTFNIELNKMRNK